MIYKTEQLVLAKGHYFRQSFVERSICKLVKNLELQPISNNIPQRDEESIRDFQGKIYLKAKQEEEFKFYILYDKIMSKKFLLEAYFRVKKNDGSPGIDGVSFEDIENEGLGDFINSLHKELKTKSYKSSPVKRVYIEKENRKKRPLGIPTIRDRVVQMSCKIVIEPIFEADFADVSYGFRPKRSAADAIKEIKENLKAGNTEVYDADLSSYFDTIPHDKLMILVAQRVSDKHTLSLIKGWLKTPVQEDGKITGGKKSKQGTPQGGVISPLLANIYLNLLDKIVDGGWKIFRKARIKIVRFADDFVLMGKKISSKIKGALLGLLERMGLRINEEKTKTVKAREKSFDFLGFTFRFDKSLFNKDKSYWNVFPSKKSLKKLRRKIGSYLKRSGHLVPMRIANELNLKLRGWMNYFSIEGVSYPNKAKRNIEWYLKCRLNRYYKRKSQRRSKLYSKGAYKVLVEKYGLIKPSAY